MHADIHLAMRQIIDLSLLGAASSEEQRALREHLAVCTACHEYLNASNRVVTGLSGFSFPVDAGLQERVAAALALRAQQLSSNDHRITPWRSYLGALILTVAGCFTAARCSGVAMAVFHLQPAALRAGVFVFWIVPSLCFCLLFPALYRLSRGEKGLSQ